MEASCPRLALFELASGVRASCPGLALSELASRSNVGESRAGKWAAATMFVLPGTLNPAERLSELKVTPF